MLIYVPCDFVENSVLKEVHSTIDHSSQTEEKILFKMLRYMYFDTSLLVINYVTLDTKM